MTQKKSELHDLPHRPGFLLRKAHQVAVAIFFEEIGELPLTPPQHNVLSAIMAHPGSRQIEVSKLVGYDRATVGALLVGMEERKLISRRSSDADRRIKTLFITPRGKKLIDASTPAMARINQRILKLLAPNERAVFTTLLAKIALSRSEEDTSGASA